MTALLEVKDLRVSFRRPDGIVRAVDGISYTVEEGETLGIVGESGSGKSVSVLSLLRLLRGKGSVDSGSALFRGRNLFAMSREELRQVRGKEIAMVFQNPMTALNPTYRIGRQLGEPLIWHRLMDKRKATARVLELLEHVGIPSPSARFLDYPFQFSGGMRQRAMIAMSLTCTPELVIADEPTTALDVTVRSQILNLLIEMKRELHMSMIIITHDFGVACNFCDRLIVMYAGRIMEEGPIRQFIDNPRHPYTLGLLRSTLDLDTQPGQLVPIGGNPPELVNPPPGCRFCPRCSQRLDKCSELAPELRELRPGHRVACHVIHAAEGMS